MRYMARVLWSGVTNVGSVDVVELMRWALSRVVLLIGWLFVLVGVVLTPTPIPIGLVLLGFGAIIILNTSATAKKVFVRWGREYPRTVGRIRNWIRERQRMLYRRRNGENGAAGGVQSDTARKEGEPRS